MPIPGPRIPWPCLRAPQRRHPAADGGQGEAAAEGRVEGGRADAEKLPGVGRCSSFLAVKYHPVYIRVGHGSHSERLSVGPLHSAYSPQHTQHSPAGSNLPLCLLETRGGGSRCSRSFFGEPLRVMPCPVICPALAPLIPLKLACAAPRIRYRCSVARLRWRCVKLSGLESAETRCVIAKCPIFGFF